MTDPQQTLPLTAPLTGRSRPARPENGRSLAPANCVTARKGLPIARTAGPRLPADPKHA